MGRSRAVGVLTACAIAGSLWGAASASALTTIGFVIKNRTTTVLKLVDIREAGQAPWDTSSTAPPIPKVGELLLPGERLHVEIYKGSTRSEHKEGDRFLDFRPQGRDDPERTFQLKLSTRPGAGVICPGNCGVVSTRSMTCDVPAGFVCKLVETERLEGYDEATIYNAPDTVQTVRNTEPQKQADILRLLCNHQSLSEDITSCKFTPRYSYLALSDPPFVSHRSPNCINRTTTTAIGLGYNVGVSTSFGMRKASDTAPIFSRAQSAIKDRFGTGLLLDEIKETAGADLPIAPGHIGWLEARAPLVGYVGDFELGIGNTKVNVTDVSFESADPNDLHLSVERRVEPMTAEQRAKLCS